MVLPIIKDRKIILFELNEVPFRVIDLYCQNHPDSCLAQYLPNCYQYITHAEDSILSPWITWPTVHRGVSDSQHKIQHFGQVLSEVDSKFPPIWQILASNGKKCGVFGSLPSWLDEPRIPRASAVGVSNTYPLPDSVDNYAFYVPDTFAKGSECLPENLSVFQKFNLLMARNSPRNVSTEIPRKETLELLANLPRLGLRFKTMLDIVQQLWSEKLTPWKRNRRRTYQAVLAFDLFLKQLKQEKPDFVTFFTNHVASSMHRYWAAKFPDDYESLGFGQDWILRYKNEIDWTMNKFDNLFAELVNFIQQNPEYTLWITSSMGQAAALSEPVRSELYLTNLDKFMTFMGIPSDQWTRIPAMVPDVSIRVNQQSVNSFSEKLSRLVIDGKQFNYDQKEEGFFHLSFLYRNLEERSIFHALFDGKKVAFESLGLENLRIEDETGSTGYHIPQGSLIIYDPTNSVNTSQRNQISTLEIAPSILRNFSVPIPLYMTEPEKLGVT